MKKDTLIKQHDIRDCGAACLASVGAFYGNKMPIAKIRQICHTDTRGTNVLGMIQGLEAMGFNAKGVKGGLRLSEYLRRCGLGREIPVLPTSEEVQAYIELKNLETNFKRISNLYLHTKNPYYQDFINEIKAVILEVQERLKSLKNGQ